MRQMAWILALVPVVASASVPLQLQHQGRVMDNDGVPVTGAHQVTLSLYDSVDAVGPAWSESYDLVLDSGIYGVVLGADATNPLSVDVFASGSTWVGVAVDGGPDIGGRESIGMVPHALVADSVVGFDGGVADVSSVTVNGQLLIDDQGRWVGPVDGLAGPQGAPGAQGPSGITGIQGLPGPQGATGPQGSPGPRGATGPTGSTGSRGPTGFQGSGGSTGATGPTNGCVLRSSCPSGYSSRGTAGILMQASGSCPGSWGGSWVDSFWRWCHPQLCCRG